MKEVNVEEEIERKGAEVEECGQKTPILQSKQRWSASNLQPGNGLPIAEGVATDRRQKEQTNL